MVFESGFYFRHQVTPFVVLFLERDGSTYLIGMLNSHPEIKTVYERFAVMRQKGQNAQEQLAWATEFFTPPFIGRKAAIGFKTKLVDVLDPEPFAQLLHEKECRVIHMRRRNRVKAVVSKINARRLYEATGNWNLYDKTDRRPPMNVAPEQFAALLQEREELDEELRSYVEQLSLPKLTVCYEDLLQDRDGVLQDVFAFLGVRPHPVEETTMKHTKDDLREALENFDALRARYEGTEYEQMFDEVLIPG